MKLFLETVGQDGTEYKEIASKSVLDADGFYNDYTMYYDIMNDKYVFVFGDNPYHSEHDWECETEEEAWEWYNDYNGFEDEDIVEESLKESDEYKTLAKLSKGLEVISYPYGYAITDGFTNDRLIVRGDSYVLDDGRFRLSDKDKEKIKSLIRRGILSKNESLKEDFSSPQEVKEYEIQEYRKAFSKGTVKAWVQYKKNVKNAVDKYNSSHEEKIDVDALMEEILTGSESFENLKENFTREDEIYRFTFNKSEDRIADKLLTLTNADTFWDDVGKLTKNVTSDRSIHSWERLAELRYNYLLRGNYRYDGSLKEEKIADKIRANQDTKEMTRRAIKTLKDRGGEYKDLAKEFKDTYGEDALEESLNESIGNTNLTYNNPEVDKMASELYNSGYVTKNQLLWSFTEEDVKNLYSKHFGKKKHATMNESLRRLNPKEAKIYLQELNNCEDIEDLKDLVHEIYWYDNPLFAQINKFPPNKSFEWIRDRIVNQLETRLNESLKEDSDDNLKKLLNDWFNYHLSYGTISVVIETLTRVADHTWEVELRLRTLHNEDDYKSYIVKTNADDTKILEVGDKYPYFYESLKESVSPDLIDAIIWNYGCSKTEAKKLAKDMSEERKDLLVKGWKDQARKSFYESVSNYDFINYNDFLADNFDGWSDNIDDLMKDLSKCARALKTVSSKLIFFIDYDEDLWNIASEASEVGNITPYYSLYKMNNLSDILFVTDLSAGLFIFRNEKEALYVVNEIKNSEQVNESTKKGLSKNIEDFRSVRKNCEKVVEDISRDLDYAREKWDKLETGIDFDTALVKWNAISKLAEKGKYTKPLYNKLAWDNMVEMFTNSYIEETPSEEIFGSEDDFMEESLDKLMENYSKQSLKFFTNINRQFKDMLNK